MLEKRRTIPQTPRKPSVRSRVLCGISALLRRSDRGRAERATCSRPFIPPGPLCSRDGTRSRLMPHSSPDSARRSRLRRSRDRWRFAPPCPRRITLPFATARPGAERSRSDRVCSNGEAVRARFIARQGEGQGCRAVPGGLKGRGGVAWAETGPIRATQERGYPAQPASSAPRAFWLLSVVILPAPSKQNHPQTTHPLPITPVGSGSADNVLAPLARNGSL